MSSSAKRKLLEERYGAKPACGKGSKKKIRRKKEYPINGGSKVVDVDVEFGVKPEVKDEPEDGYEDAPAVVAVEDESK